MPKWPLAWRSKAIELHEAYMAAHRAWVKSEQRAEFQMIRISNLEDDLKAARSTNRALAKRLRTPKHKSKMLMVVNGGKK